MLKSIQVSLFLIFVSLQFISAQETQTPEFEFYYKWGTYGHRKVSSKKNKVYVKVQHPDVYADTSIVFTQEDKDRIWQKIVEINFFNYPEDYTSCYFKDTSQLDFIVDYDYILDKKGFLVIDSSSADTIWDIEPLYFCEQTIIPYGEYEIIVYLKDQEKSIAWQGGYELVKYEDGKEIPVERPLHKKLLELGGLIREITESTKGYQNLPKSHLIYY